MGKRFIVSVVLIASLAAIGLTMSCCVDVGGLFGAEHEKTESLTVPMTDTKVLAVESNVGSITVTGAETGQCSVTAEITVKAGSSEKAEELAGQVGIEVEPSGEKLTVRVARPEGLKDRSLKVDFTITAPYDVNLVCSTDVGSLTISGMKESLTASTDVGSIICTDVMSKIDLRANVGSITVKYDDRAPDAVEAEITTNVGSIEFSAPAQLSAEISASTNVGSVETSRPITVTGKMGKSMKGTVGEGKGKISLRTNVGSIGIR